MTFKGSCPFLSRPSLASETSLHDGVDQAGPSGLRLVQNSAARQLEPEKMPRVPGSCHLRPVCFKTDHKILLSGNKTLNEASFGLSEPLQHRTHLALAVETPTNSETTCMPLPVVTRRMT